MKYGLIYLTIAAIIICSSITAYAGYYVCPPQLMDTSVVYEPASNIQSDQILVRNPFGGPINIYTDWREAGPLDLWATRISPQGEAIDPIGKRLTTYESVTGASACSGQCEVLVVYSTMNGGGTDIYGMILGPDCSIAYGPFAITYQTYRNYNPSVSFDGTNFVVVWESQDNNGFGDIYMKRVTRTGTVLDATPRSICTLPSTQQYPKVYSALGTSLIVWTDARNSTTGNTDIYGTIIDSSGTVLTPAGIPICTDANSQTYPACCYDGSSFKVVWSENSTQIRGIGVSLAGAVIDSASWPVSGTGYNAGPVIDYNGINCVVAWTKRTSSSPSTMDIYGNRIDSTGARLDGDGFAICSESGMQAGASITAGNGVFTVGWTDYGDLTTFERDLFAIKIGSVGNVIGSKICAATSAQYQELPAAAYNGSNCLVCWQEYRGRQHDIYGSLAHEVASGFFVPGPVFPIATGSTRQRTPSVCWNGENYMVAWVEDSDVRIARVTPNGSLLDPTGIIVGTEPAPKAKPVTSKCPTASDGSNCAIVYHTDNAVRVAIVSRSGAILSNRPLEIFYNNPPLIVSTSICWTGSCYIAAWEAVNGSKYQAISKDGSLLGTRATLLDSYGYSPALACNGKNVMLAWLYDQYMLTCVRVKRLSLDGTPLDAKPTNLVDPTNDLHDPRVSWDGTNYVVSWTVSKTRSNGGGWNNDILSTRFTSDGVQVDPTPLEITNTSWGENETFAQCNGSAGETLIFCSSWRSEPYNSMRMVLYQLNDWLNFDAVKLTRDIDDATTVNIAGKVVTAVFPTASGHRFYVQDDFNSGLGVNTPVTVAAGDSVTFTGSLQNCDGERVIDARAVSVQSSENDLPIPLGMLNRCLPGVPPNSRYEPITGGLGTYNMGLLVKVWGRVVDSSSDVFYISDGSEGGRLKVYGSVPVAEGSPIGRMVSVTGISGAEKVDNQLSRVLRATNVRILD